MNTVLDDNKLLSLANSQRIKMTNYMHLLFEVQDLAVASPATVSQCAMVYVNPDSLTHVLYVTIVKEVRMTPLLNNNPDLVRHFQIFSELSIVPGFDFMKENSKRGNVFIPMNLVFSVFNLFEALVNDAK